MSKTKDEKEPKKIDYPVFELKSIKIPLIIKRDVINKVNYLCDISPTDEWSGILITRKEGDLGEETSDLKIVAEDVFPMDVGEGMTTSYEYDKDIIDLYTSKPEFEQGHEACQIHSHCNSSVFFSSTDDGHVMEGAIGANYFVSLIVNNKGEYKAKLAMETHINIGQAQKKVVATMEMLVFAEDSEVEDEVFIQRISQLFERKEEEKKKKEAKKEVTAYYPSAHRYPYDNWDDFDGFYAGPTKGTTKKGGKASKKNKWWQEIEKRFP